MTTKNIKIKSGVFRQRTHSPNGAMINRANNSGCQEGGGDDQNSHVASYCSASEPLEDQFLITNSTSRSQGSSFDELDNNFVAGEMGERIDSTPLVPETAPPRRKKKARTSSEALRRRPFEIVAASIRDEEIGSWSSDGLRMIGSVVLSSLLLAPLVYSYWTSRDNGALSSNFNWQPITSETWNEASEKHNVSCSSEGNYDNSFELLSYYNNLQVQLDEIGGSEVFCDENITPSYSSDCTCSHPLVPLRHVPSTPQYFGEWDAAHARNVKLVSDIEKETLDVLLLGDSITERFQGTSLNQFAQKYAGSHKVYQETLEPRPGLALGVSGDRCPQLLWRIQHGEMPIVNPPRYIWLLIGTNDLGEGCRKEVVLMGILNIVLLLLEQTKGKSTTVIINGILPRPANPTGTMEGSLLWDYIQWINNECSCFASQYERVGYFDASSIFLKENKTMLNKDLMPDTLHPNGLGAHKWAEAIASFLDDLSENQAK